MQPSVARLAALGHQLPPVFPPAGNYLGCKRVGNLLFVGGHGPTDASGMVRGKVGAALSLEAARRAAEITALSMLFWAAVVNGVLAPPLIVLIVLLTSDPRVMGTRVNPPLLRWLGWLTATVMTAAALAMLLA